MTNFTSYILLMGSLSPSSSLSTYGTPLDTSRHHPPSNSAIACAFTVKRQGSSVKVKGGGNGQTMPWQQGTNRSADTPAAAPKMHTSRRLVTTTPETSVGVALESVKASISPKLLLGLEIQRVSSKGVIVPRMLTFSNDLFTIFISHTKAGKSFADKLHYNSFKTYESVVSTVTGITPVQSRVGIRVIDVADILFVQSGFIGTRKLEACKTPALNPGKVISIFHNNMNTTDFLVEDEEDRLAVIDAIHRIRDAYHVSKEKVGREELLLRYTWYDIDGNKSGSIEQSEFLRLLTRINIYLKQEKAIKLFKDHKHVRRMQHNQQGINFDECLGIIRKIKLDLHGGRLMSDVIFDELFREKKEVVSAEEFMTKFLHQRQKEFCTLDDVKRIFSKLNSMEISGARHAGITSGDDHAIDRVRFGEYLTTSRNDAFDPRKQTTDEATLSNPMPEYWINSSHNTYLTADQWQSISSVEMYVVALHRGCRCLELDCWDDGVGYPVVYHGYTLTTKISFQSIISAVKGFIDANLNTLPIILSLENHCSHPFQEIIATILVETLQEYLYVHDESSSNWPSPLDLVGKVIVKCARPPEKESTSLSTSFDSIDAPSESTEGSTFDELPLPESKPPEIGGIVLVSNSTEFAPQLPRRSSRLSRMVLFNGVKFKSFSKSIDILPPSDMHSFSEVKLLRLLNKDPSNISLWKQYNREHMTRIYPHSSRVDSSNYNPVVAWAIGSQLVALNFQTDDFAMTINDGRFRENGRCGYVHKPPSVLSLEYTTGRRMMLLVKVMYGSCLPKPYGEAAGEVISPYVIVRVHDVKSGAGQRDWLETTERRTSPVRDNGFCPKWNDSEYFAFAVNSVDVAMVEFIIMDSDNGFINDTMCKSAVPVSCLRQGIRSVQFYDRCGLQNGPYGLVRLLVEVDIKYSD